MNLYLLQRKDEDVGWDEAAGFVVAAYSVQEARDLAAAQKGDEGAAVWQTVPCVPIGDAAPDVKCGVVLRSFYAG